MLTREQVNIPGVHMIGHANFQTAASKLETHFHKNMEFVVVIKGRQQYIVSGKRYVLYGNEMFMTYPYEHHGNKYLAQDICDFIWFQLDVSSMQDFPGLTAPRSEYLYKQVLNYRSRFKAKFKGQMGVTPHAYMNALKIDSAKIYLKAEKLSVTEIAYMLNFSSSHHFASVFKKYVGCTPTEFRKQRFSNIY